MMCYICVIYDVLYMMCYSSVRPAIIALCCKFNPLSYVFRLKIKNNSMAQFEKESLTLIHLLKIINDQHRSNYATLEVRVL